MSDSVQEASGSSTVISHLSTLEDKKSLPSIPANSSNPQESRLWIGNLDSRITEYHLVKVLQKHGKVTKFDFLFHKTGPLQGQPKGYCFVTFETKEEAENALRELDGKLALSKKLSVKWAYLQSKLDDEGIKPANSLGPSAKSDEKSDESISAKIRAIEAKLKAMEENKDSDNPDRPELPIAITHPRAQPTQQRNRYRRRPYYRPAPSRSRRR